MTYPSPAEVGELYHFGGRVWQWDGTNWVLVNNLLFGGNGSNGNSGSWIVPFVYGGPLHVASSPLYYPNSIVKIAKTITSLKVPGTTQTDLILTFGAHIINISIDATEDYLLTDLSSNNYYLDTSEGMYLDIDSPGTDAEGLSFHVFLES